MCLIDDNSHWYGDGTYHPKVIWIEEIRGATLRQAICKLFNTTSGDIKNSPGLYGICGEPIQDYNIIIDDSFNFLHITKKPKKIEFTEFHKEWGLTKDTYNVCSEHFLILPFNPKDNEDE